MWRVMKESVDDLRSPSLWRSVACEMLGTLVIVLLGCGAWISAEAATPAKQGNLEPQQTVQVAMAFGLGVATVVWTFGHISGGHFNPAVTAAALVTRRVSLARGVIYVIAQSIGAILGASILYGLTPEGQRMSLGVTRVVDDSGVSQGQAFGVEMLVSWVVVMAFCASRDPGRGDPQQGTSSSPGTLTVGVAVLVCHLFAIHYTRAGMNCARSFGPAVVMNIWDDHWVYWVGPLTGGVLAGLLYDYIFSAGATVHKTTKCLLRTKQKAAITTTTTTTKQAEKLPLEGEGKGRAAPEVIEIEVTKDQKEATAPIASAETTGNEIEALASAAPVTTTAAATPTSAATTTAAATPTSAATTIAATTTTGAASTTTAAATSTTAAAATTTAAAITTAVGTTTTTTTTAAVTTMVTTTDSDEAKPAEAKKE